MLYFKNMDVLKNTKLFTIFSLVMFFVISALAFHSVAVAEPDGYSTAKVELARLLEDEKRGAYRHNWLRLADNFSNLYRNNANWNNRAAALFRSAKCLEEMARRSYVRKDAQAAATCYEDLVKKHSISPLADDSLYAAACIYHELLNDTAKAKSLLKNIKINYAKTDFAPKAKTYMAKIDGTVVAFLGSTTVTEPPKKARLSLNAINPQVRNDVVRIVLSISAVASWRAKYFENVTDEQPGIVITLKDVAPSDKLSLEEEFRKSGIFIGYTVEYDANIAQSTVFLDFSDLTRYTVKAEKEPARLIIEATNSSKSLSAGINVGKSSASKEKAAEQVTQITNEQLKEVQKKLNSSSTQVSKDEVPTIPANLAAQLGLAVRTIVIDPGHGGRDPGAINNGVREKDINLDVAKKLKNVLTTAGYKVFLTRTEDVYIGLYERTDIARKHKADLFISIHANAHAKPSVSGFETYYLDFSDDPESIRVAAIENVGVEPKGLGEMEKILGDILLKSRIQESKRLAKMVQKNSIRKASRDGFKLTDRGMRGAPFHVLIGSSMPSILVEIGFTTNAEDAQKLKSQTYRNSIADGIANGIHQYASQLMGSAK